MTRPFDCFVGIDWSGAKGPWQKGIKVAIARPGSAAPTLVSGSGRRDRWSRAEVAAWITNFVADKRALIGFDFAFGFPNQVQRIGDVALDWNYVETLCGADSNFYGGQFFRALDAAHIAFVNSPWVPRSSYSAHCLRATDLAAKKIKGATPQSIFNAVGPAQVGPSSISGMRMLLQIKKCSEAVAIWPFDTIDDRRSVIVEIFPRYLPLSRNLSSRLSDHAILNAALEAFFSSPVVTPPASEDEGDALLTAAALRRLSTDGTFFKYPSGSVRNEGWIFGVPLEGSE